MSAALRVAIAMLPADLRGRYREEWTADLAAARHAGVGRLEIVAGALATAVRLAGLPPAALAHAWIRRDVAAWATAAVVAASFTWMVVYVDGAGAVAQPLLALAVAVPLVVAIARSARLGGEGLVTTLVCSVLGAVTVAFVSVLGQLLSMVLVLAPVVIAIALIVGVLLPAHRTRRPSRVAAAIAGGSVLLAAVVAVVDSLVLLPLTLAPGWTLPDLYAALAAAGEGGGEVVVAVWGACWAVVAVALAAVVLRRAWPLRTTVAATAGAIAVLVVSKAWSVFTLGMGIADALLVGGGQSWLMPFLGVGGAIAALVAVVAWLAPRALERAL